MVRYDLDGKMPDSSIVPMPFPVVIDVPLRDSLDLRTSTTWTLNDQHIRQMATIRRIEVKPAHKDFAGLKSGISYQVFKTREEDITNLDKASPTDRGETSLLVPVKPATDGYLN